VEQTIILTVYGATDAELAEKLAALRRLAGDAAPAGGDGPRPFPPQAGLIEVGDASGKRGATVAVEIRGHADIPVMGFAAAVGFEDRDLEFLGVDWPDVWGIADGAEVLLAEARTRGDRNVGNAGPCVLLNIARFDIRSDRPGATGPEAGVMLDPVNLPPGSLLATLRFKIAPTAKVGKELKLLNWSRAFGSPKLITEFTTLDLSQPSHRTMGPAVEPALEDGVIVVTG
jgi:hypothetical protein